MNNISIARETIKIIKERKYTTDGCTIELPDIDYGYVNVFSPDEGKKLIEKAPPENSRTCRITVTNEDSFQAAKRYEKPFVMNFANAHSPGGGFLLGANAQEEALCRCGAFRNKPENVAEYFRTVLFDEYYSQYFTEICFAVYGDENSRNISAFRECFKNSQ